MLVDMHSGQQALVATGKTSGDDVVNTEGMRASLAKEIVETLIAQEMLLVSDAVSRNAKSRQLAQTTHEAGNPDK